jgi:hypothetical protein
MYGCKYAKSIVNLEPNEVQLDSNRSFELKRFWSFPNRIDFTSSLTRLDGNTTANPPQRLDDSLMPRLPALESSTSLVLGVELREPAK